MSDRCGTVMQRESLPVVDRLGGQGLDCRLVKCELAFGTADIVHAGRLDLCT